MTTKIQRSAAALVFVLCLPAALGGALFVQNYGIAARLKLVEGRVAALVAHRNGESSLTALGAPITIRPSRNAWPSLGMDKTIALAEGLAPLSIERATIFCPHPECDALAHDIDDAMQINSTPSDIDRASVDSTNDVGVFVSFSGVSDQVREFVMQRISLAVDSPVALVDGSTKGVAIYLGRRPRQQ